MRSVTGRWKDGVVHVHASYLLSGERLLKGIDEMAERLLAIKPASRGEGLLKPGDVFRGQGIIVGIKASAHQRRGRIGVNKSESGQIWLILSSGDEHEAYGYQEMIRRGLRKILRHEAPRVLLPRGGEIATALGCRPSGWRVSEARTTHGTCSGEGLISLSAHLMMMPRELSDYIICHELAHLTHHNHSRAFHELCDRYCRAILGRGEREMMGMCRRWRSPF